MPNSSGKSGRTRSATDLRPTIHIGIGALIAALALAKCANDTLDTGDVLILEAAPDQLTSRAFPDAGFETADDCVTSGGSVVSLAARSEDGTVADGRAVTVSLDPALGGSLIKIPSESASQGAAILGVTLGDDGTGTTCLFPGLLSGTITVHATSGTVSATDKSVTVSGLNLPAASTLKVIAVPLSSGSAISTISSTCGAVAGDAGPSCSPGEGRQASLEVTAVPPSGGTSPVADGTLVTLTVDSGWLAAAGDCSQIDSAPLVLPLTGGAVGATWCFGDQGATATATASSGSVTSQSNTLTVPAIPASLYLAATTVDAGVVALSASASDCNGGPIAGIAVALQSGTGVQFGSATPIGKTGTDGTVVFTGTVSAAATVEAVIIASEQVNCSVAVTP